MTLAILLGTILVGLITGFLAGMFGIGGALLSTPLLVEIVGLPELVALATPLPATIPAAVSGSVVYRREGYLRFDVAGRVLAAGLPMSILGAWLVRFVDGPMMMVLTGIVLIYSAVMFLRKGGKKGGADDSGEAVNSDDTGTPRNPDRSGLSESDGSPRVSPSIQQLAIGALAGFASGFLAIGGGMIMVPAFVFLLRLSTKQALATSLVCVAGLAIPGTVVHHLNGFIDWPTTLILMAVVIPVSALGARVASRMRSRSLELIYGIGTLAFAVAFIVRQIQGAQ